MCLIDWSISKHFFFKILKCRKKIEWWWLRFKKGMRHSFVSKLLTLLHMVCFYLEEIILCLSYKALYPWYKIFYAFVSCLASCSCKKWVANNISREQLLLCNLIDIKEFKSSLKLLSLPSIVPNMYYCAWAIYII